jgi:hypothetical protein
MKMKILLASGLGVLLCIHSVFALDGVDGRTLADQSVRFVTQTSASSPLAVNQCL